jgi:spore maturation protein CgeB
VQDGSDIFGEDIVTYNSEDEFRTLIPYYLQHPDERSEKAARVRKSVLENHTFAHRAEVILKLIRQLDGLKRSSVARRDVNPGLAHA